MNSFRIMKDSKNRAIFFHWGRIFMYAVLYGIALFFYFFLYGYVQYVILMVLTVIPVISVVSVFILSGRCDVRLTVSEQNVKRMDKFSVGILLQNHTIMTALNVKCCVQSENLFYQTKTETTVELPMVMLGESKIVIPLKPDRNGMVQISAISMTILDFCGLISVVVPVTAKQFIQVFPENMELTEEEKIGFYAGLSNNEEDILKGNDFADIGNLREYVPGDRMKDIHWKLSAKKEMLLVKERIRLSENQLVVFLELSGNHEQMDDILKLCYNLIRVSLQDGILVKLIWFDRTKKLVENVVANKAELQSTFGEIYQSGIGGMQEEVKLSVQGIPTEGRNAVRTFVKVGLLDGRAGVVVIENEV